MNTLGNKFSPWSGNYLSKKQNRRKQQHCEENFGIKEGEKVMQSALPSRQQSKFWPCGAGKQCNHNIQQFEGMFVVMHFHVNFCRFQQHCLIRYKTETFFQLCQRFGIPTYTVAKSARAGERGSSIAKDLIDCEDHKHTQFCRETAFVAI